MRQVEGVEAATESVATCHVAGGRFVGRNIDAAINSGKKSAEEKSAGKCLGIVIETGFEYVLTLCVHSIPWKF